MRPSRSRSLISDQPETHPIQNHALTSRGPQRMLTPMASRHVNETHTRPPRLGNNGQLFGNSKTPT